MINRLLGIKGVGFDADAQAFIDATQITNSGIQTAHNTEYLRV